MPPPGGGGPGAHGLWDPSGGELGAWLGIEHLTLEGADGDLASAGCPVAPLRERNKVGRQNSGDLKESD